MRWFRKHPARLGFAIALLFLILLLPAISSAWTTIHARASQPAALDPPLSRQATALFGSLPGNHPRVVTPASIRHGGQFPGLAGHAVQVAGAVRSSPRLLHSNSSLATNIVVSSDTTPAPFGPQPRNGPQAAIDPTNFNHLVVAYNDYTVSGQGGISTAGYAVSHDGGASWSASQSLHGLLRIDGGAYDGAADPGIAFDAVGNAYLSVTTFDADDWATAVYVAEMPVSTDQFGSPVLVAAFNDTHRVVQYARIAPSATGGTLYLTFNALGTSPQTPGSSLAPTWSSQLYFTSSSDSGQSWSAPVAIGKGPQDYWGAPLVDWNGNILVFYSGASGLELTQSGDGGQSWSSPRSLQVIDSVGEQRANNDLYVNPGPSVALDMGSRTLYVEYDGGKTTFSNDDGATWSQPIDVLGSVNAPAFLAAIGVDPVTHTVSVGGYSTAGDPSQNTFAYYYAQSADGGNHFSSPALLSENVSLPPAPAFGSIGRSSSVVSSGHFAHLFWTDTNGTGGNEQIVSASINVGQPFMGALQNSWDSTQTLSPQGIVFTQAGSQNVGVGNYGQGSIGSVSATACSGCGWLSASVSASGNAWVVTISTPSAATSQVGSVTIQASGLNSSITIPVQLQIDLSTPAYSLESNTLSFTTLQGVDPPTQAVQVADLRSINVQLQADVGGDPVLNAVFSNGGPSIILAPGMASGLIVLLDVSGLPVGSSTHTITLNDGNTTMSVTIHLTIQAAPAQLSDPASSLNFAYHQQDASQPLAQSLVLRNSGGSDLHWHASTDAAWLSLGAASGTMPPGSTQQVTVNVNASGLSQGTSTGHIVLGGDAQAIGLPEVIPVYLVVSPPAKQIAKTWYFAEGYVSANFSEYLTLENPNAQAASVSVTYLTQPINQSPRPPFTLTYAVNAGTRYTVPINSQPGIVQNDQVSLVVNSNLPIVAERPMYFTYTQLTPNPKGGSDVLGATHLNSTFFFPFVQFGSDQQQSSPTFGTSYSTYLTVLNQNNAPVDVTLNYSGAGSLYTVTHTIAANTRGTLSLASDFPLAFSANHNSYLYTVSLLVMTDLPVVVELPSYFTLPRASAPGVALASGTDETGSPTTQASWDFAEGYTGTTSALFLTYLDLANMGDVPSQATLTLLVTSAKGVHSIKNAQISIAAQTSVSISINALVCPPGVTYCSNSVAAHVQATQPLVVDRQMLFNYNGKVPGTTAVVGSSTGPQAAFYFAEGYTGPSFSEYLTFVSPMSNSGSQTITIRYLIQGKPSKTVTIAHVSPGQRVTENVNADVGPDQSVSAIVTVNAGTLLAERPMYFHFRNVDFGGSDVIGYTPGN